jgi:DNA primase
MRFSDALLDDIRRSSDIVEVVGGVVKLRRRGKNFIGLCPFHQEKTPSFNVNPEMQIYKCFGCGKGGNVFQFVMETERVSFVEAVRSLADRAGIKIPEEGRDEKAQEESDRLHNALRFAGRLFHDNLTKTDEGRGALEYFKQRGFSDDTMRAFGLGYALNSWDNLLTHARREGIGDEDLLAAGLLRKRDDGSLYDYFRGRAMFPIFSAAGRVVAFGARRMHDDDPIQGKYINSPETPVYSKSRVLFGLSHAKEAIRQTDAVLLVEGYADMISLFQAGVQNVVASSGTALTEDQLSLLGRYTKNLVLVYDGDSAGSRATIRGIDLALEKDMDLRIVALPTGEDPDSFVRNHGAKAFRDLLGQAVSFIDFKALEYRKMGLFDTTEGKAKAVRAIVQSIARISDELKRAFFIKDVAERYGLYESVLWKEMEKAGRGEKGDGRRGGLSVVTLGRLGDESRQSRDGSSLEPPPSAASTPREVPPAERAVLKLFLELHRDAIEYLMANLHEDDVTDPRVNALIQRVLHDVETTGTFDVAAAIQSTDDPSLRELMTDTLMSRYELSGSWEKMEKEIEREDPMKVAHDAVFMLRKATLNRAIDQNQFDMRQAAREGRDTGEFLRNHQELLEMMKRLEAESGRRT